MQKGVFKLEGKDIDKDVGSQIYMYLMSMMYL